MIVITGTGRAGTTFLVSLFTLLGFRTGFSKEEVLKTNWGWKPGDVTRAGLEKEWWQDLDVVKSPSFCYSIHEIIEAKEVECVLVPMRDLDKAAKSRIVNQERAGTTSPVAGGFIGGATDLETQKRVLLEMVYSLCLSVARSFVPVVFLEFPRFINDSGYLFRKLTEQAKIDLNSDDFNEAFTRLSRPELVESWNE